MRRNYSTFEPGILIVFLRSRFSSKTSFFRFDLAAFSAPAGASSNTVANGIFRESMVFFNEAMEGLVLPFSI